MCLGQDSAPSRRMKANISRVFVWMLGFAIALLGETHAEETSARFHPLSNLRVFDSYLMAGSK